MMKKLINSFHMIRPSERPKFFSLRACLFLLAFLFLNPISALASKDFQINFSPKEEAWLAKGHIVHVRVVSFPPFSIIQENQKNNRYKY